MKLEWCWRCKIDVPMLDEAEYARVAVAIRAKKAAMKSATQQGLPLGDVPEVRQFPATLNRIAGAPVDAKAFMSHPNLHRLATCGPPCPRCGKVLRTPKASKCFECGLVVHLANGS